MFVFAYLIMNINLSWLFNVVDDYLRFETTFSGALKCSGSQETWTQTLKSSLNKIWFQHQIKLGFEFSSFFFKLS